MHRHYPIDFLASLTIFIIVFCGINYHAINKTWSQCPFIGLRYQSHSKDTNSSFVTWKHFWRYVEQLFSYFITFQRSLWRTSHKFVKLLIDQLEYLSEIIRTITMTKCKNKTTFPLNWLQIFYRTFARICRRFNNSMHWNSSSTKSVKTDFTIEIMLIISFNHIYRWFGLRSLISLCWTNLNRRVKYNGLIDSWNNNWWWFNIKF